jgi:hypothetical protein
MNTVVLRVVEERQVHPLVLGLHLSLPILKKKPYMGVRELQTTLQDTHNCTIAYETVWNEKEKALAQLYGT